MARFTNLDGSTNPHGLGTVMRWKLGLHDGRKIRAPSIAEVPRVANDGAALRGAPYPACRRVGTSRAQVQPSRSPRRSHRRRKPARR